MRAGLMAVVVALVSCSKAADTDTATNVKPAGACANAAACEKGCAAGRLADCHELAWRKIRARGTPIDFNGAEHLLARACAGKLVRSCGMAAWVDAADGVDLPTALRSDLDRECRAGDGWSCAALASWALRPATPGSRVRDTAGGATWAELGCRAGHIWSCATLEIVLVQLPPQPDWTEAMRENHAKLRKTIDEKRAAACAAGNREGCHEDSSEYRTLLERDCAAKDHGACAELAVLVTDEAERQRLARDACDEGKIVDFCPIARGGCAAIDIATAPHLDLKILPRLTGPTRSGRTFDSAALPAKKRMFVFTASWNQPGSVADIKQLAAALSDIDLVVVFSDPAWDKVSGLEATEAFTAVLDPPAAGENIGRYTSALGISKVPEAFLLDPSGAVRRHLVGSRLLTDRMDARRCADEVLGPSR